nr:Sua5/YciO/YrdC/YwlC family protein [uncultured Muribaculum sp.]
MATALATALGNPLLSTSLPADPDMGNIVVTPDEADLINPTVASIIIDAGECGHEQSTIVNLTDSASPVIERPGAAQLIY